jgi:2-oxoisovalerate dehydrogenase E2 component (dihydrolipoyl transacylase)
LLTDIGEGIAECEILKWFVKVGDHVEEFDKLVEVQSDKANVVIPSRYSGLITKVYAPEGEMIKVGAPLIDIKVEGDGGQEKPEANPTSAPSPSSRPHGSVDDSVSDFHTITTSRGPVKIGATPAVRRIARELGINLSEVSGSGKDGRVTKDDIQRFATEGKKPKAQQTTTPITPASTSSSPTPAVSCPLQFVGGVRREPIRGIRRAMVKTMTATTAVPHLGYCDEITMDALMQLRDELRTIGEKRGTKITYMPFILKATSLALKAYPILNSSVSEDGNEVLYKESHNIGIAMDTPQGLIVPNIKNCQLLSVFEIAQVSFFCYLPFSSFPYGEPFLCYSSPLSLPPSSLLITLMFVGAQPAPKARC